MAAPIYLADTSALVYQGRDEALAERFEGLLLDGRVALCQMTAMEFLNNAPNLSTYKALKTSLLTYRWIDSGTAEFDRALEVHVLLAAKGQHRNFSLPDLIIAATAELNGATVLHYDSDYDRIAELTGQQVEWVAPQGSL